MAANTPQIDRLLSEFKAQDLSTDMIVLQAGKRIRVATWSDGNQNWQLTDEGETLLNPQPAAEPVIERKGLAPTNLNIKRPK